METPRPQLTLPTVAARDELTAKFAATKDLRSLLLADGQYDAVELPGATLDTLDLRRTNFQDAKLQGGSLRSVVAVRAIFTKADLSNADLRGADLRDASFNSADLTGTDVRGCSFSAGTNLNGAKVRGAKIDRQALRMLGVKRGGLTEGDIASMEIHDDLVKLTTGFGGFWSVLHLLAVTIFLIPYISFGLRKYIEAQLVLCQDCVPLREAIWQYVVSGGKPGGQDTIGIIIFVLLLAYNIFRASLVYKAQSLRLAESAAGFSTMFTLRGYWRIAYYGCQILVWLNLALVALHAYQLLGTPVSR